MTRLFFIRIVVLGFCGDLSQTDKRHMINVLTYETIVIYVANPGRRLGASFMSRLEKSLDEFIEKESFAYRRRDTSSEE
jgi:hypothetical protein